MDKVSPDSLKYSKREDLEWILIERIKELRCLYEIARIAGENTLSISHYLREVVEILPAAWQYPEITCARIKLHQKIYKSRNFSPGEWKQQASIILSGMLIGQVEVVYTESRPEADEGPFLKEERHLIEEIAKRIGETVTRIVAEEKLREANETLEKERRALREANSAFRALLSRIREEELEIKRDITTNVGERLIPIIDNLERECCSNCKPLVRLLRATAEEIASPFLNNLKNNYSSLTPTELQICHMIRNGLRSKEIAMIRNVSVSTIHRHRERIRQKLGINNSGTNMAIVLREEMPAPFIANH